MLPLPKPCKVKRVSCICDLLQCSSMSYSYYYYYNTQFVARLGRCQRELSPFNGLLKCITQTVSTLKTLILKQKEFNRLQNWLNILSLFFSLEQVVDVRHCIEMVTTPTHRHSLTCLDFLQNRLVTFSADTHCTYSKHSSIHSLMVPQSAYLKLPLINLYLLPALRT